MLYPKSTVTGQGAPFSVPNPWAGGSGFLQQAAKRPYYLVAFVVIGIVVGLAYRRLFDEANSHDAANYVRSALHGLGIALTAWTVQTSFAVRARSQLGLMMRRLPISGELIVRSMALTVALLIAGVGLQFLLYAEPLHLHWLTTEWVATTLPRIVVIGFAISLLIGFITETHRLVGGPVLKSVVLGTYHRPVLEQRIVMFLDIAHSTRLAEKMGELRVHDLITRFFYDIDEPISDHGGAVHAYVGDEVIVTWPITGSPSRDGRCLTCFSAIDRKMARLSAEYERDFHLSPSFRAAIHAGPIIISECGDAKRQLAYFGDTMNVGARLCEHCKSIDQLLVVSANVLKLSAVPADLVFHSAESVTLRGRIAPVATHLLCQANQRALRNLT